VALVGVQSNQYPRRSTSPGRCAPPEFRCASAGSTPPAAWRCCRSRRLRSETRGISGYRSSPARPKGVWTRCCATRSAAPCGRSTSTLPTCPTWKAPRRRFCRSP
jgi:hypothetical protein